MTESLEGGSLGPHYTVPGILHYLQHEFTSYELDRIRWEDERTSLKVCVITSLPANSTEGVVRLLSSEQSKWLQWIVVDDLTQKWNIVTPHPAYSATILII